MQVTRTEMQSMRPVEYPQLAPSVNLTSLLRFVLHPPFRVHRSLLCCSRPLFNDNEPPDSQGPQSERPTDIIMATSIFSRKRDLVYLIYFCIAVPMGLGTYLKPVLSPLILLQPASYPRLYSFLRSLNRLNHLADNDHVTVVDLQPIYPPSLIPAWMTGITDFYVNTYHDQFFIKSPPFFDFFLYTELFIQIPTEIWAIAALRRSMPRPFSPSD
jgi:hypothetical protein